MHTEKGTFRIIFPLETACVHRTQRSVLGAVHLGTPLAVAADGAAACTWYSGQWFSLEHQSRREPKRASRSMPKTCGKSLPRWPLFLF